MAPNQEIIIAFEPYGTLLSMESVALKLADHIHERAETVATVGNRERYCYPWLVISAWIRR